MARTEDTEQLVPYYHRDLNDCAFMGVVPEAPKYSNPTGESGFARVTIVNQQQYEWQGQVRTDTVYVQLVASGKQADWLRDWVKPGTWLMVHHARFSMHSWVDQQSGQKHTVPQFRLSSQPDHWPILLSRKDEQMEIFEDAERAKATYQRPAQQQAPAPVPAQRPPRAQPPAPKSIDDEEDLPF